MTAYIPGMSRRSTLGLVLLAVYVALSCYVFGCLVIENDVNYVAWNEVGAAEFPAFHRAMEAGLRLAMFTPMAVQLVVGLMLIWFRPPWIARGWVIAAVACNLYVVVESMLVQVPLHQMLEQAKSAEHLQALLRSHRLYRLPVEIAGGIVAIVILWRTIRTATSAA